MTGKSYKRWLRPIAIWTCLAGFIVWAALHWPEAQAPNPTPFEEEKHQNIPVVRSPMPAPAVNRPKTVPAAEAKVADDEDVIGIAVGGKYRAYCVSAMKNPWQHIVNDLLERVPVTVTYCDLLDCVQAFTSDKLGEALNIQNGGINGEMVLKAKGVAFWQLSGLKIGPDKNSPVFPTYPFERMKWKDWHRMHPTTDVFVGIKG
jgi:Protein of unknown function (DUF3179)